MERRILIVDDEVTILSESKRLMENHGAEIDIAENMEEALTLLNTRDYESVIVGLKFADSLGDREFEILKHIKEDKTMTGIILLTGCGNPKLAEDALSIGAAYYYEKRIFRKILREALKKCNRGYTG